MDIEYGRPFTGRRRQQWADFLAQAGLDADPGVEFSLLLWEGETIAATGSRQGNILKCIAVAEEHQGEGLTATLLTELRREAFDRDIQQLFLYTKPKNRRMFEPLFFYPVAETADVLLMENVQDGAERFVRQLPAPSTQGAVGAAVMNCNPFTLGHRHLIETAAAECDWLYVFVLSEEGSMFPAADRLELVRRGTADLSRVTVAPTGPYLISSATFPSYFIHEKSRVTDIQCQLDLQVFARYFVPRFGISRRYVGTEPFSPVTAAYNEALKAFLPSCGVQLRELPRKTGADGAAISASAVRALLHSGAPERLRAMVPESTYQYLQQHELI